ncbi:MAG: M48 family metalloprotease [Syntrophales bacterium]|jgi:predicted Zn-dependent protease|nr:M48 family metalloprotease [Syntrophales bacterium]MDY0044500.1 M48 family metalloprotease [Syntrophales bacterium]
MKIVSYMKIKTIALFVVIFINLFFLHSACASFTLEDEKRLGKEFYDELQKKGMLVDNPELASYIDKIGYLIAGQGEQYPLDFTFSMIRNSGINAFATPGGYVYVYTGLIELAQSEDQLAGVLAHEIAHIKARHIARAIEKSKKINIASLAAVLAGVFLGGGEGAAAISSFAMATAATMNLKYSRDHEEEADRLGMSYLVSANYDGKGMLEFLKCMRQYEYYSNSVPSYFLTHPGTGDRISYLTVLLQSRYDTTGKKELIGGFPRIKTRLALAKENFRANEIFFSQQLESNPGDVEALYGLAVSEAKLGKVAESKNHFRKALEIAPHDYEILRDFGISYFEAGDIKNAVDFLRKSYTVKSDDNTTLLYLGRSYEAAGNLRTALELFRNFEENNPSDTDIFYNLAMTYGKLDILDESHYYFGKYFKAQNKKSSALFHFKTALDFLAPGSTRAEEIKKDIESLEEGKS